MNRRRFLQALFAVPCLAAPLLVPTVVFHPPVYLWAHRAPSVVWATSVGGRVTVDGPVLVYRFRRAPDGSWVPDTALLGEGG